MKDLRDYMQGLLAECCREDEGWVLIQRDDDVYIQPTKSDYLSKSYRWIGTVHDLEDCKESLEFYFIL